jgi:DNA-binding transcriptional MerR regulator
MSQANLNHRQAAAVVDENGGVPIRTVSALTGVNSFTLRAWERRYGLVKPARTPTGRRVYTPHHIEQIRRILALLDSGMAIGQVARLVQGSDRAHQAGGGVGPWLALRNRMWGAVTEFDERGLESAYQEALSLHPIERVTERLLLPLLRDLGTRWLSSDCGVAEEHFFSVYLRNKLGARFHHRRPPEEGPGLVCACLPGEQHELGLLLFALAANDRGYRVVLLGADMPLDGLASAVGRIRVDAVALSGFMDPGDALWGGELQRLVATVQIPVFVGGPVSLTHRRAIGQTGAHPLGCDFTLAFKRLAEVLNP